MRVLLRIFVILAVLAGLTAATFAYRREIGWFFSQFPQIETVDQGATSLGAQDELVRSVAQGLIDPSDFVFLPDGSFLVAERGGVVRHFGGATWSAAVDRVHADGAAGLLGLALHPRFEQNHRVYAYQTVSSDGLATNQVVSYRLDGARLVDRTTVCQGIPGGLENNGGAITFGPDGKLYVATGDAGSAAAAQDQAGLAGKILRINDDGSAPSDNPGGRLVWAWGFHDPRGLVFDGSGQLWAADRGEGGWLGGHDEINLVQVGKNYGWPDGLGGQSADAVVAPTAASGFIESWEPAGLAYFRPHLYFAGERGESLYALEVGAEKATAVGHLQRQLGRLRAVRVGPDGAIYVLTDNTGATGRIHSGDDQVYRLEPKLLGR